jgi:serine/threonine-protein kinase NIM1
MNASDMASDGKQTKTTSGFRKVSAYEKLTRELENDQKIRREVSLGKRIGLYRVRGELGAGNFSQVKMGIHALTKGKLK